MLRAGLRRGLIDVVFSAEPAYELRLTSKDWQNAAQT